MFQFKEVATSFRRMRTTRKLGAALTLVVLVWAVDQYREHARAATIGGEAAGVVELCQSAVNERWPGAEPLRFDDSGALRNLPGDTLRFVSQFETTRGERVHFSCEAQSADDGGWLVSRLSIVSR
jgi:hypothetical protein